MHAMAVPRSGSVTINKAKNKVGTAAGSNVLPVGDLLPTLFQEVREIQNDGGLRQLGRLKRKPAQADPAMRVGVAIRKKKTASSSRQ